MENSYAWHLDANGLGGVLQSGLMLQSSVCNGYKCPCLFMTRYQHDCTSSLNLFLNDDHANIINQRSKNLCACWRNKSVNFDGGLGMKTTSCFRLLHRSHD